jgi:hypothetical protein
MEIFLATLQKPKHFLTIDISTSGFPEFPSFGCWYSPTNLQAYNNCRVNRISCVSKTQSWTWYVSCTGNPYQSEVRVMGQEWNEILVEFLKVVNAHDVLIGNNIHMIISVIASEMFRHSNFVELQQWKTIQWDGLSCCSLDISDLFFDEFRCAFMADATGSANAIWDIYMHRNGIPFIPKALVNRTWKLVWREKNNQILKKMVLISKQVETITLQLKTKWEEL